MRTADTTVTNALTAAYRDALDRVAMRHNVQANEVRKRTDLQRTVFAEALASLSDDTRAVSALAREHAPRQCQRKNCPNDALAEITYKAAPDKPIFCSRGCYRWAAKVGIWDGRRTPHGRALVAA